MKAKFLKKGILLVAGLILAGGLVGCGADKKSAKTDSNKVPESVVVGIDNTFVPMGFLDKDNNIVGFDIDLAKEAFKRAGVKNVKFENIDWSMKEQSLENGNVDALWNGYTITKEREKKVLFTDPYLDNAQIVVTMSSEPFKKIEDLKDQSVGTQAASSSVDAIDANSDFKDMIKDKAPVTYDTFDKALRDLEIGRTKAVVGDEVLLKYYIKQRGADKYKVLDGDLGKEEYGVGFRKNDKALRDKVNKALSDMKNDGKFDEIKAKWFN